MKSLLFTIGNLPQSLQLSGDQLQMRLLMCGMLAHNEAMTSMIPPISIPMGADMFIEMVYIKTFPQPKCTEFNCWKNVTSLT